jgi:predicted DNA-binding transcriptional regulator AlpA
MANELKHRLVKQENAATYLGLSEATLERDRWRGGDIPFVRIGPRAIRYDLDQLNEYINRNTVRNASLREEKAVSS